MALKKAVAANLFLYSLTISGAAFAAVSAEEAARLDGELTPLGAERAGNADGSIPDWTGGLQGPPEGISIGENLHRPNPFPDDEILLTITGDNYTEHTDSLMPSSIALFENVPGFYMNKGSVHVPLNVDVWTKMALGLNYLWSGFYSQLGGLGESTATLNTFGPQPVAAGLAINFVYMVLNNPSGSPIFASNPIYVLFTSP